MLCFCFQWFSFFWYFDLNWPGNKPCARGCKEWRWWKGKEKRSKECQVWRRWEGKERYEEISLTHQRGKGKKRYEARFKNKTTPPPLLNFSFLFAAGWRWGLWDHAWKLQFPSQKSWNPPWAQEMTLVFFQLSQCLSCSFFWFPSDIHHILIKVWVSKVWVLSKFDQTLTFESLSFVKVWWNSDFRSLSFVKVWLLKVWVLSKFDF